MTKTLRFKEEDVKEYLDSCIKYWRKRKEEALIHSEALVASCYIDAFQSVRVSLFEELLPISTEKK